MVTFFESSEISRAVFNREDIVTLVAGECTEKDDQQVAYEKGGYIRRVERIRRSVLVQIPIASKAGAQIIRPPSTSNNPTSPWPVVGGMGGRGS